MSTCAKREEKYNIGKKEKVSKEFLEYNQHEGSWACFIVFSIINYGEVQEHLLERFIFLHLKPPVCLVF